MEVDQEEAPRNVSKSKIVSDPDENDQTKLVNGDCNGDGENSMDVAEAEGKVNGDNGEKDDAKTDVKKIQQNGNHEDMEVGHAESTEGDGEPDIKEKSELPNREDGETDKSAVKENEDETETENVLPSEDKTAEKLDKAKSASSTENEGTANESLSKSVKEKENADDIVPKEQDADEAIPKMETRSKVQETKSNSVKSEGSKTSTSASKLQILDKKKDGSEDFRAMAKLLYDLGKDLAQENSYRNIIRVLGNKKVQKRLTDEDVEKLDKLKEINTDLQKKNQPYCHETRSCFKCNFKTESINVLQLHFEGAHGTENGTYECVFCDFSTTMVQQFFSHMEQDHKRRGRVIMPPASISCPVCAFEHNSKSTYAKHKLRCHKAFVLKRNLEPVVTDCDIPLKKPPKPVLPTPPPVRPAARAQVRPPPVRPPSTVGKNTVAQTLQARQNAQNITPTAPLYMAPPQVQQTLSTMNIPNQQVSIGGVLYNIVYINGQCLLQPVTMSANVLANMSKVNLQSVPRPPMPARPSNVQQNTTILQGAKTAVVPVPNVRPQQHMANKPESKFEICEICGGFVKDKESLRIHFYWAHKVDISRILFERSKQPTLACDACSCRFWTAQGLTRHRFSAHGAKSALQREVKMYTCRLCNARDVTNLLDHLSSVHKITIQSMINMKRCLICGETYMQEKLLEYHLMSSHAELFRGNQSEKAPSPRKSSHPVPTAVYANAKSDKANRVSGPVQCSVCGISFSSAATYNMHYQKMHSHGCHRCSNKFESKELLKAHWRSVHSADREECPICHVSVFIGTPFIRHMKWQHMRECKVKVKRLAKKTFEFHMNKIVMENAKRKREDIIVLDDEPAVKEANNPASEPAVEPEASEQEEGQKTTVEDSGKTVTVEGSGKTVTVVEMEVDGEKILVQQEED